MKIEIHSDAESRSMTVRSLLIGKAGIGSDGVVYFRRNAVDITVFRQGDLLPHNTELEPYGGILVVAFKGEVILRFS